VFFTAYWVDIEGCFIVQMDHPAALHRLRVGVPATVEHSSEAGPETGKWVAETTQVRSLLLVVLLLLTHPFL
jgi:ESCRT-I complex subunit VPS28